MTSGTPPSGIARIPARFDRWARRQDRRSLTLNRPSVVRRRDLLLWPALFVVSVVGVFAFYVIGLVLTWPMLTLSNVVFRRRPLWLVSVARWFVHRIIRCLAVVVMPGMSLRQLIGESPAVRVNLVEVPVRKVPMRLAFYFLAQIIPTMLFPIAQLLFGWPGLVRSVLSGRRWSDRWWNFGTSILAEHADLIALAFQVLPANASTSMSHGRWRCPDDCGLGGH